MAGASSRIVRISRSLEGLYLSDWYFGDLRALKMCGADCSLNTAWNFLISIEQSLDQTEPTCSWASEATIVSRGNVLNLIASARSFGSNNNAIKNVEITLTVIVLSIPSTSS